jgi:hypothetical protein
MPVSAAAVRDLGVPAFLAAPNVPSQRRRTAGLDCRHHAPLATIEMPGVGLAIVLAVTPEDIRHLKGGASHANWLSPMTCTSPVAAAQAP